jgi:hypothetical protein
VLIGVQTQYSFPLNVPRCTMPNSAIARPSPAIRRISHFTRTRGIIAVVPARNTPSARKNASHFIVAAGAIDMG